MLELSWHVLWLAQVPLCQYMRLQSRLWRNAWISRISHLMYHNECAEEHWRTPRHMFRLIGTTHIAWVNVVALRWYSTIWVLTGSTVARSVYMHGGQYGKTRDKEIIYQPGTRGHALWLCGHMKCWGSKGAAIVPEYRYVIWRVYFSEIEHQCNGKCTFSSN
jgi:hypothetical protein